MGNVSLKLSLLIFILVITSNFGAESRVLSGTDEKIEVNTGPPCKRDIDCTFRCPNDGVCNVYYSTCECK
ncbi:hypothetical protein EUTSA_v10003025mg [Eutrema salsugineum]|uniref:Uncharacterized protein n=1 Tax=Eutrema salsugineum TaxID=72664 RepID=V4L4F5_EUTSA|nr:putative defensin-like protein 257 [Eutrema salsugineum]ESQ37172.1 hypothetical protein EUTSA_v10003025mg [Eutrema salsugineum]